MTNDLGHASDCTVNIGPLRLTALRYQFPDAEEYWDANWLVMNICCSVDEKSATLTDPCLLVPELGSLSKSLSALLSGAAQASLDPIEPYFALTLKRHDAKSICVKTHIWETQAQEPSRFRFDVPLSDVERASAQLVSMLQHYPVRGQADVH